MFHNIERSPFKRGRYIGYAKGVWHIRKIGNEWHAVKQGYDNSKRGAPTLHAPRLREVSAKLHVYATTS